MIKNLIDNIQRSISQVTGKHHLRLSIWGNDVNDSFQYHYDFHNFSDSFISLQENEFQPANIILIMGSINFHQIEKIKEIYEKMDEGNRFVVNVKGSLYSSLLDKSYMTVKNLQDHLHVDLEYSKYPFSLEELLKEIIEMKDGTYE